MQQTFLHKHQQLRLLDKSTETTNVFQNSLYTQTPAAENLLPLISNNNNLDVINQQRINFQNDINRDGYFDPENKTFINNRPPPPDYDHGGGRWWCDLFTNTPF